MSMSDVLLGGGVGVIESAFDQLVDSHVGIVHQLREVACEPGTPNFFHYAATGSNTQAFCNQRNFHNTGGAATTRKNAMAKAIGEAVERYAAAIYQRETLPLCSRKDAPFACVDPSQFALYSRAQYESAGFPWVPFDDDSLTRWTPARRWLTGETVHVPAAFTWIPYFFDPKVGEAPIGQSISTGLACHGDLHRAAVGGLCEVIERDAFTLFWQRGLVPAQLRVETLSDDNYDRVKRFEVTGDRITLLDISLDHAVPCVLSVLHAKSAERPALVFAASADPSAERAVAKALEELAHTRRYSQRIHAQLPPVTADNDWEDVTDQVRHLSLACQHAMRERFDFAFSSRQRISFEALRDCRHQDAGEQLDSLVADIEARGHPVLVAELSSSDIASLGLRVVRVLVPGFHPLFMGHRLRALGGQRLWTVPERLGLPALFNRPDGNPTPHPYP